MSASAVSLMGKPAPRCSRVRLVSAPSSAKAAAPRHMLDPYRLGRGTLTRAAAVDDDTPDRMLDPYRLERGALTRAAAVGR